MSAKLLIYRYFRPIYYMKKSENSSLKIQNIVSAGSIAESIDLEFIGNNIPNCTFTKKKFPGAVFHMQNPKSAALIFSSGRVVLTGHHRSEDIPVALQNLLQNLKEAGISCKDNPQIKVTNIVCTYDLGFPLNLVRITTALMDTEQVEYEPEAFPGLVCRISDPKIVFLLFSSGKIVITGATIIDDVKAGLNILMEKLSVVDNKIQRIENL
jgi:transcription initiation factor TFIID TATA-box-binding protein